MRHVLSVLLLGCAAVYGRDNYTVETIPDPPSAHGSKMIDGLTFMPDGRLCVCLASGEVVMMDVKTHA
ncbi:MAG: hypothetical protein AAF492_26010, partial [Verrucomicrobiota bacterium]